MLWWLVVSNKFNNKKTVKKEFSIFFFFTSCFKNSLNSLMYWLKICKAWVRSQLRWAWNWLKLNVTSSNVLRLIIHWLSARSDVGLTQGSLIPREHSLYRALKHSIRQFIIKQFERRAHWWNVFQHSKRNFVSLRGHVISSIYSSSKLKTKLEVISRYHEVVRSHFVK